MGETASNWSGFVQGMANTLANYKLAKAQVAAQPVGTLPPASVTDSPGNDGKPVAPALDTKKLLLIGGAVLLGLLAFKKLAK